MISFSKLQRFFNGDYSDIPLHVQYDVPYHSQFASEQLVQEILNGAREAKDDPKWQESGADTVDQYELWAWSGCGMACLKMILSYKTKITYPLVTLGLLCQRYGAYPRLEERENAPGLVYKPFIRCIKKEFNLNGRLYKRMTVADIVREIAGGNLVIASVSAEIRSFTIPKSRKGGHLVLVTGYNQDNQTLTFHNPSGIYQESQRDNVMPYTDFLRYFANRGVSVSVAYYI